MASIVDLLAVTYDLDLPEAAWLDALLVATRPHLDHGLGVIGFLFDTRRPEAEWASLPVTLGSTAEFGAHAKAFLNSALAGSLSASMRQGIYFNANPRVSSTTEAFFQGRSIQEDPTYGPKAREIGFSDFFGVRCSDPVGVGCVLGALTPDVVRTTAAAQHRWSRIAAHIDAALRLRAAVASGGGEHGAVEAIFTANGEVEHAAPAAQAKLADLRLAVDQRRRIHGRAGRLGEDGALDLWRVLVQGRWSLVDRVEPGGRRSIVAHHNAPAAPSLTALSPSEAVVAYYLALGRSNKLIAYELGLADGTVASFVARLRAKLAARSRAVLVRECGRLVAQGSGMSGASDTPELAAALSPAEGQIADLAVAGYSNAEIAERQGCSRRTVDNHLAAVYRKLGIGSRAELVRMREGNPGGGREGT